MCVKTDKRIINVESSFETVESNVQLLASGIKPRRVFVVPMFRPNCTEQLQRSSGCRLTGTEELAIGCKTTVFTFWEYAMK